MPAQAKPKWLLNAVYLYLPNIYAISAPPAACSLIVGCVRFIYCRCHPPPQLQVSLKPFAFFFRCLLRVILYGMYFIKQPLDGVLANRVFFSLFFVRSFVLSFLFSFNCNFNLPPERTDVDEHIIPRCTYGSAERSG
ncbi:hypothetical protein DFH11DRAFT_1320794 [Phellopilus nigrolimitatus]|nr:hypothetical protein DFH11DRAFT_1320794 [Phellopilus nigrolimitatus]